MLDELLLDLLFIGLPFLLKLLLPFLMKLRQELSLLLFELNSVLLVLQNHTLELLVHIDSLGIFDPFPRHLCFIIPAFLDTLLLMLEECVARCVIKRCLQVLLDLRGVSEIRLRVKDVCHFVRVY